MVSLLAALVVLFIVVVNTVVAALLTRAFRVRLETAWGAGVFVAVFVPVVLTVLTILLGSVAGPSLGSRGLVLVLFVGVPLALGVTIDVFWMPAPEQVELPAEVQE